MKLKNKGRLLYSQFLSPIRRRKRSPLIQLKLSAAEEVSTIALSGLSILAGLFFLNHPLSVLF